MSDGMIVVCIITLWSLTCFCLGVTMTFCLLYALNRRAN